ncbi:MAG: tetratricopeptide repeat protein [Pedobacter sp.]
MSHYLISYPSTVLSFALLLCDELQAGPPAFRMWLDKRELKPGDDWDRQIAEAINTCEALLFLMTKDSVSDQSVCKPEWSRALKCKKPIVPLLIEKNAALPFRLENRQFINFTVDYNAAMARLRLHLQWLHEPTGVLHCMKERLADAERDLRRAADQSEEERIRQEIDELTRRISIQQAIVDDPQGVARRVQESIDRGLERERIPLQPTPRAKLTRFINPPPTLAPNYFQDRLVESGLVGAFLADESKRLMTVVGRAGVGKTAMVCRVLKALEGGQLPDDGGPFAIDGIVYLSAAGTRRITLANIFADLSRLLDEESAKQLETVWKDARSGVDVKLSALLEKFPSGRHVLLLDNFEDLITPENHNIRDSELDEALRAMLTLPHHGVKVIITTRIAPHDLALLQPGRQTRLELDKGLDSPYAENILRQMDADGTVGLKGASDELLGEARRRTLGFPRALEALFAILSADRFSTIEELLSDTQRLLPANVVESLVGEAFNRLDTGSEKVMQALAVYARPVTPVAVDYLLQPFMPGIDSAPVLNRLTNMHFVRKESGRYHLHPIDRSYALERIKPGDAADRSLEPPPFTRFALLNRGAGYFRLARAPREHWKGLEDIAPQLAEFDLRCQGGDFETAAGVLLEFDFDYLLVWGHYRLAIELHERLRGCLSNSPVKQACLNSVGSAYYRLGEYYTSALCYEEALELARAASDSWSVAALQGNLGNCYGDMGDVARAIGCYEAALQGATPLGDPNLESNLLNNLGFFSAELGWIDQSLAYHIQALETARRGNNRFGESIYLANIGARHGDLGEREQARKACEEALGLARSLGFRYSESVSLTYLGDIFSDSGDRDQALDAYSRAIMIAEETGNLQFLIPAICGKSVILLKLGETGEAAALLNRVARHREPRLSHYALAHIGTAALRQGDKATAAQAFRDAMTEADAILATNGNFYRAFDARGIALCGLMLCGDEAGQLAAAVSSFRLARSHAKAPGIVARLLRLFDELAIADACGIMKAVRAAAAGV